MHTDINTDSLALRQVFLQTLGLQGKIRLTSNSTAPLGSLRHRRIDRFIATALKRATAMVSQVYSSFPCSSQFSPTAMEVEKMTK